MVISKVPTKVALREKDAVILTDRNIQSTDDVKVISSSNILNMLDNKILTAYIEVHKFKKIILDLSDASLKERLMEVLRPLMINTPFCSITRKFDT